MSNPNWCGLHSQPMSLRESKTKFNDDGSPKTYLAHLTVDKKMCFGNSNSKDQAPTLVSEYKGEPRFSTAQVPPPPADKVDWDAKDRQSMAQTAMKCAAEIIAAMISIKAYEDEPKEFIEKITKDMAKGFYNEILGIRDFGSSDD